MRKRDVLEDIVPFVLLFREQGEAETRTITLTNSRGLPDGIYALADSYCTDPTCDCQRVLINVINPQLRQQNPLATISYGFDRDAEMAGPFLDPLNKQSIYAPRLLAIVEAMLDHDVDYVNRLKAHYRQVKDAIANPKHPIHQQLRRMHRDREQRTRMGPWL